MQKTVKEVYDENLLEDRTVKVFLPSRDEAQFYDEIEVWDIVQLSEEKYAVSTASDRRKYSDIYMLNVYINPVIMLEAAREVYQSYIPGTGGLSYISDEAWTAFQIVFEKYFKE